MNLSNKRLYTAISLICLVIAISMLGVWRFLFDPSSVYGTNLHPLKSYIPGGLEYATLSTVACILLYAVAILFAIKGDTTTTNTRKGIHFWAIVVALVMLIISGYSLIR